MTNNGPDWDAVIWGAGVIVAILCYTAYEIAKLFA
jgi:hypothetical protein